MSKCRACNKTIEVVFKSHKTETDSYVTFLESLCSTCLLWASLASGEEKDVVILPPVGLGEWLDGGSL